MPIKLKNYFSFVTVLLFAITVRAADMDPNEILKQVDQHRLPSGGFEALILITPSKDGVQQDPGQYLLRSNGENQTLVEALNIDQRGQKFLTTTSGLFFFAPRTRRAIRITPLQTLRGQASIGDISRLHFASDYDVIKSTAVVPSCKEPECIVLELSSKNEEATYSKIILSVKHHNGTYDALNASLFLASGKQTKSVEFGMPEHGLPPTARYIDVINTRYETVVVYKSIKPATFPSSMFNPRSLE